MSLASELIALRRQAGVSQRELARRTGFSSAFLSDLEQGFRGASLDALERIAEALSVDPAEFHAYRAAIVATHPEWVDDAYRRHFKAAG